MQNCIYLCPSENYSHLLEKRLNLSLKPAFFFSFFSPLFYIAFETGMKTG